jgi:methionyl-tRNA formyltransferase
MVSWEYLYSTSHGEHPGFETQWRFGGVDTIDKCDCTDTTQCAGYYWDRIREEKPDLIITAFWRHLVPKDILDSTPLGVVGFHSAKLPEYPGRAPVPWTLIRGDEYAYQTMLFLTDEPDAGDIIDQYDFKVDGATASSLNNSLSGATTYLLRQHLPALLAGTAPRTPQDRSKRGPLTKANGWQLLPEARR